MPILYTIHEIITGGFKDGILVIISLIAILSGILILTTKNPVVSILFLISLFGSIAVYLITLGLTFVGFAYLIVYIGAVSILFLFILMLINIRISELQNDTRNSIPLAILILSSLSYSVSQILPYDIAIFSSIGNSNNPLNGLFVKNNDVINSLNNIFFVNSNSWDANLIEVSHIASIGNILYTSHNIWLIITSFILLLSMVGAIVVTLKNTAE